MERRRKNYLIYVIMLLLFGGLIYVAIQGGERFDHLSQAHAAANESAFDTFRNVLTGNLNTGISVLLMQIIIVLLAVRLFSYLFRYIGQPGVIGEIVAGIVLGPSLLGYFFPDIFGFLFRPESLTNLELISQLGLILFMFVIGMELDFGEIKKKINETLVISHAGILVPFFLGIIASYWVYEEYASSQTSFLPFALFIGISMSITAFPVLARIIQERGMTKTPVGIISIASAANDDVTAWCLLAIVIAIAKAGTLVSAVYAIILTFAYIIIMFCVVRPFLKRIGNVYATGEVINKTFVSFIFLILVISATLTELIGIHALFGAFMAGVVMPSNVGFRKVMMEKVEDISLVFFLPLFFAYTGLHTEIGLIDSPQLWIICGLFILVAVLGKFGGCALAARLVGESWKDSLTIGTLMNTRGLMELIALNIGYEMGVLPPSVFVILVIMALVTTFMTTPSLSFIDKFYAKKAEKKNKSQKLLLCFGRPESGEELLAVYYLLFGKLLNRVRIIAAHYTVGTDLNPVKAEQYARDSFVALKIEAQRLNISVDERYKVTDKLMYEIAQLTKSEKAGMLLIGSSFRSIEEAIIEKKENASGILSSLLNLVKNSSLNMTAPLLREKAENIADLVRCPVAVFVGRNECKPQRVSFLLGGAADNFLLPLVRAAVEYGVHSVDIFLFKGLYPEIIELSGAYPEKINLIEFTELFELNHTKNSMLVISHEVCAGLLEEPGLSGHLPSLLVVRPEVASDQ